MGGKDLDDNDDCPVATRGEKVSVSLIYLTRHSGMLNIKQLHEEKFLCDAAANRAALAFGILKKKTCYNLL